jgi:ribonuclease VapC
MIIDSSALVAIFCREPGYAELQHKIEVAANSAIPAPIVLETAVVLSGKLRRESRTLLEGFLKGAGIEVLPFSADYVFAAHQAFEQFGKGRHPAALNFGDCMSYAAAKMTGEPLLFVGSDFSKTDLVPA